MSSWFDPDRECPHLPPIKRRQQKCIKARCVHWVELDLVHPQNAKEIVREPGCSLVAAYLLTIKLSQEVHQLASDVCSLRNETVLRQDAQTRLLGAMNPGAAARVIEETRAEPQDDLAALGHPEPPTEESTSN